MGIFFWKKSLFQKQLSLGFNLVYWYWAQAQVYKTREFKDEKRVKEMVLNKTRSGFRVELFSQTNQNVGVRAV